MSLEISSTQATSSEPAVDRYLRRQSWMDPLAKAIQKLVAAAYRLLGPLETPAKNVAHGTWALGHPLHPAMTDLPLGAWTVGVIVDYVALRTHLVPTQAGDIALLVGVVGAVGAAVTGYTDFHETYGLERRAALSHGLVMTTVVVIEVASLLLRWLAGPNFHVAAVVLATVGLLLAMFGMYLGGHVVYAFGTMINRNAFADLPSKFTDVGSSNDFPAGKLHRAEAGSTPILLVRLDGRLHAIAATCSHAGGPLDEGTLDGDVVTCPWHGSRFCVRDGAVRRGPATFSQPAFVVKEEAGRVMVRSAAG